MKRADLLLFAATVAAWSVSWYALHLQVGLVPPEISAMWRFAGAATVLIVIARLSGVRMRYPAATHARFALVGALMFSTNLVFFYHAALTIASGLLSVVFSLASILNLVLAAVLLGLPPERRVVIGAVLGAIGVALMFAPDIAAHGVDLGTLRGLAYSGGGTLCFCLGNIASSGLQRARVPPMAVAGWGMAYGASFLCVASLALGLSFDIDWRPVYLGSFVFLVLIGSVGAFLAYLTLLGRVGPGRAAYTTVAMPVIALLMSTAFEGYRWTLWSLVGLAVTMFGILIVLRQKDQVESSS